MDYDSQVRRRFLAARRAGSPDGALPAPVAGEAEDRTLNVWIRFQLWLRQGTIRAVRYNVYGCPHTVAAVVWAAGWLEGRPAGALSGLSMRDRRKELGVPVEKLGKLLILEDALAACRRKLEERKD